VRRGVDHDLCVFDAVALAGVDTIHPAGAAKIAAASVLVAQNGFRGPAKL